MNAPGIEPKAPLRVMVVGAGAFGRNHLRVYRELERAGYPVELAAVIDPDAGCAGTGDGGFRRAWLCVGG